MTENVLVIRIWQKSGTRTGFGANGTWCPHRCRGGGSNDGPKEPNLTSAERKAMEAYRFDSTALERAAQAARELEKSSKETLIRLCNISAYPHLTFLYFSSGH